MGELRAELSPRRTPAGGDDAGAHMSEKSEKSEKSEVSGMSLNR